MRSFIYSFILQLCILTGFQLGNSTAQQQQLHLGQQQQQLSMAGKGGQGIGGLPGLTSTHPVGTVAPSTGGLANLTGGVGLANLTGGVGLRLPTSTSTTASLAGGTGLQLNLQPGQTGLSQKPANTSTGLAGLHGLTQASQLKLQQPGQTGLAGQLGLSQPLTASTVAPTSTVKPQTGLPGLTGLTGRLCVMF